MQTHRHAKDTGTQTHTGTDTQTQHRRLGTQTRVYTHGHRRTHTGTDTRTHGHITDAQKAHTQTLRGRVQYVLLFVCLCFSGRAQERFPKGVPPNGSVSVSVRRVLSVCVKLGRQCVFLFVCLSSERLPLSVCVLTIFASVSVSVPLFPFHGCVI